MKYLFILIMLFPIVAFAQYKTSDCDGLCGENEECKMIEGIPTCVPITEKCNPRCPKGQKCVQMTDGSYQCISVSPNPDPNALAGPDNAVPLPNCSLAKINCPYNLIIIILLIINIVLTFKIYRRR